MRALILVGVFVACDKPPPTSDEAGNLRVAAMKAIERGSITEAEVAVTRLAVVREADRQRDPATQHSAAIDADVLEQLAELYRARWESAKPHTVRVIESYAPDGVTCSRVSADITFPDPSAMGSLTRELQRGRALYRQTCNFRWAYEASALLGDAAGYEADIAAMHGEARTKACSKFPVAPLPEHDAIGVELAFAGGDAKAIEAAVTAMVTRSEGGDPTGAYRCRTSVARGYLAEQRLAFVDALRLYKAVDARQNAYRDWHGPSGTSDDCFPTAAARRLALEHVPGLAGGTNHANLPRTRVTARIDVPPATIVRVAFQAQPPVLRGDTPALFGNGTSIRHPWPSRDEYFFVDATITDGTLVADLPPGWWLPQIELDPAGKWTLGEVAPCLTSFETLPNARPGAEHALPDLTFIPVQ